jgi:hypothetical protein
MCLVYISQYASDERDALEAIRNSLSLPENVWLDKDHACDWEGVVCISDVLFKKDD